MKRLEQKLREKVFGYLTKVNIDYWRTETFKFVVKSYGVLVLDYRNFLVIEIFLEDRIIKFGNKWRSRKVECLQKISDETTRI